MEVFLPLSFLVTRITNQKEKSKQAGDKLNKSYTNHTFVLCTRQTRGRGAESGLERSLSTSCTWAAF